MAHLAEQSLTQTPTWAAAAVCVVFIVLSVLVQQSLQKLGKFLLKNRQKPLYEALQKMKEELMLLGFMSLLLTAARNPISKFCVPRSWVNHMLPCKFDGNPTPPSGALQSVNHVMRLHFLDNTGVSGSGTKDRNIEGSFTAKEQCEEGYTRLFSIDSLHELDTFTFMMAVVHVVYSCLTVLLGFTQLRKWKGWDEGTSAANFDFIDEISQSFKLERQSTFVISRTSTAWCTSHCGSWVASFFRQFGNAVTKSDYLSLRMGFIKNHNASKKFNFHEYIMRCLEKDFKRIVGISGYLWIFVIIVMTLNVNGWYAYFWISFVPILINMVIGTKLQHIISQLALEAARSHIDISIPIQPRDELFWFNKPHLLLYLIHFVLFQNAFELAYCLWLLSTFGVHSCLVDKHGFIIIRVVVGLLAQILCSYSTLPLYALVSQMGSQYKQAIFDEPVQNAIQFWQKKAKENRKMHHNNKKGPPRLASESKIGRTSRPQVVPLSEVSFSSDTHPIEMPANSKTTARSSTASFQKQDNIGNGHLNANLLAPNTLATEESIEDRQRVPENAGIDWSLSIEDPARKTVLQQVTTVPQHLKYVILGRSRSHLESPIIMPSLSVCDWATDIQENKLPRHPRRHRSFGERSGLFQGV